MKTLVVIFFFISCSIFAQTSGFTVKPNGDVDVFGAVKNVTNPVDDKDAATKEYVDKAPLVLESTSAIPQTGIAGQDFNYNHVFIELTKGTWYVQASVTLSSVPSAEIVGLSFWNDTKNEEFLESITVAGATSTATYDMQLTNFMVVTVNSPQVVKLRIKRNTGTTITVGNEKGTNGIYFQFNQKILAFQIGK